MPPFEHVKGAVGAPARREQADPVDPQRWERLKAVFLEALEHAEDERSAFVEHVCAGDRALQAEVESLLASDRGAGDFIATPAAGVLAVRGGLGVDGVLHGDLPPRLPAGTKLGLYEITGFIAAGGMGEVYRARHTILGRAVAIKIVGGGLDDGAAGRRLLREATHAARLNHPNICTIHEVGESSGVPFIVMELVEGRPLSDLLGEEMLPLRDALTLGMQIADALDHAHEHGVVHRDLKSANVVIDPTGKAVVLDFGLARRLPSLLELDPRDVTLTNRNLLAGTLSHMAPELLRGEPADVRSDVWALGVLLFELVTGELPFRETTVFETSAAILGSPPRLPRVTVPLAWRLVIEGCLAKSPADRFQSARAVYDALGAVGRRGGWPVVGRLFVSVRRRTAYLMAAAALLVPLSFVVLRALRDRTVAPLSGRISTLAVLPLHNGSPDKPADYYADGITDALISQLGAASDVRILSRTSVTRVARLARTPADIGKQLGADVFVTGTVRHDSARVTIDINLVQPADGRVLWSRRYERGAREVLAIESDVVSGLADATRLTLRPSARQRLLAVRAVNPDVYEEYLKGRYEWNQRTDRSLARAMEHFTNAIDRDPTYAPAHAALADCFNQLGTVMVARGSPGTYRPRAEAEAIKALQLDESLAEAHATLGFVWHYDLRWVEAEREFRRALDLNSSYSLAHIWYANLLMGRGRKEEAVAQVLAARDLDPFSLIVNTNVGWVLNIVGRHDDAIAQLTRTIALDSTYAQAHWRLSDALIAAGRGVEAVAEGARVVMLTDSAPSALAQLAKIDALADRRPAAQALLRDLLARRSSRYVPSASIANIYAALGDVTLALAWMEKAFDERSNAIAYLSADPYAASLRDDRRFKALIARAGLE
jgi:TolB-like protein/Tfp pilus assembly protein PilF/tRNA A-37 threonylcarbamoyl transferase component Bud32